MPNINSKTVIEYIYDNELPFKGEKFEFVKKETTGLLITPLKVMALLVAVSGLFAMVFEVRHFSQLAVQVYFTRLIATLIAFLILVSLNTRLGIKNAVINVHLLLAVIILSSGYMIYLMPHTLVVNAQIMGLMIFTSALFLSWEVKNQIIVAIYYNIVFAAAILLNDHNIYFLPNMYESVIFVLFLSLISVVGSAVNFKLRMQVAENSFKVYLSEKKYRSIFDNSSEGLFQSSPEGRILTLNNAMAEILGYTIEELLTLDMGRDIYRTPAERETLIKQLTKDGELKNHQLILKHKSGKDIVCCVNAQVITDESGNNTYYEGNIRDITEKFLADKKREIIEQELREEKIKSDLLAKDAMQSSLIKSQFLANMSHEIRTPMNGIIGFLTLIQKEAYKDNDELKQFANSAKKSAESLLDILNDVLDLSKIESGKMELDSVDFNLSELIDDSVSVFSTKIREKSLKVTKHIDDDTLILLNGASTRIRQVLVNLIGNAVKFTDKGEIAIKVKTIEADNDLVNILFSVQDTGIGIPKDKIQYLFQPFSQVDGSHSRRYGGTGLGLVICKEFVNMMGGEINIESEEGKGSNFFFNIKLKPQVKIVSSAPIESYSRVYELTNENDQEMNLTENLKKERGQYKILLAEDNFINQKVALRILNEAGFKVEAVINGVEAVEWVKKTAPDLILMDVQMPEMDGFTATKTIRTLGEQFKNIPVIAITAHALTGDKQKCIDAGMNDYVSKPIISEKLIAMLDHWLNIKAADVNSKETGKEDTSDIFDLDHLNKMSLNNLEFQKDLIITYLQDLQTRCRKLEIFIENDEFEKLTAEAHTIKGASLSVGAVLVGKRALEIEMMGKQKDPSGLPSAMDELLMAVEKTRIILHNEFQLTEL